MDEVSSLISVATSIHLISCTNCNSEAHTQTLGFVALISYSCMTSTILHNDCIQASCSQGTVPNSNTKLSKTCAEQVFSINSDEENYHSSIFSFLLLNIFCYVQQRCRLLNVFFYFSILLQYGNQHAEI